MKFTKPFYCSDTNGVDFLQGEAWKWGWESSEAEA